MSPPQPDLTTLYFEDCGILLFAPANLADEVQATRDALAEAQTWGAAITSLSRYRLDELREHGLGEEAPLPGEDAPLEAPDDWPVLRSSEMPSWLPPSIVERFGQRYSGLFDSGTNFDVEDWGDIEEALEELGIAVSEAPMSLEEIFD
jgi:hypothetical protein